MLRPYTTLFDVFFDGLFPSVNDYGYRTYLDENDLLIEKDLPGFSDKTLSVELDGDILCVSGKTDTRDVDTRLYLPRKYLRNTTEFEAEMSDGVLTIRLKGAAVKQVKERKRVKLLGI